MNKYNSPQRMNDENKNIDNVSSVNSSSLPSFSTVNEILRHEWTLWILCQIILWRIWELKGQLGTKHQMCLWKDYIMYPSRIQGLISSKIQFHLLYIFQYLHLVIFGFL